MQGHHGHQNKNIDIFGHFKSAKKDENKDDKDQKTQKTRAECAELDFCRGQRLPEVTVLEGLGSLKGSLYSKEGKIKVTKSIKLELVLYKIRFKNYQRLSYSK